MRLGLIWLVVGGCAFRLPGAAGTADAPAADGPAADVPVVPPADMPPPADAPLVTCTTSDPDLVVCLELEDPANLGRDGSGRGHGATMANVAPVMRPVPETSPAAELTATSSVDVADTPDFNLSAFTLAAWVDPSANPGNGGEVGVLDLGNREAALVIDDQGRVLCYTRTTENLWFRPGRTAPLDTWSFIACTYQPPMFCTYVLHADGRPPDTLCGQTTDGAPMRTSSNAGLKIGSVSDDPTGAFGVRLTGGIDAIRVYRRGLSQAELCASGGVPGC